MYDEVDSKRQISMMARALICQLEQRFIHLQNILLKAVFVVLSFHPTQSSLSQTKLTVRTILIVKRIPDRTARTTPLTNRAPVIVTKYSPPVLAILFGSTLV